MTREEQFDIFWRSYPNRKGKADARKAFEKAIKQATLDSMLKAITAYVANKPEWQGYKHPGTWLRSGSWDDEWEPPQSRASAFGRGPSVNEAPAPRREPETPEQRVHRQQMAARLREVASSMRAPR